MVTRRRRFENVFQILTAALAHLFVSKEGIPELPYTTMLDRYVLAGLLVTFGQLGEAVIVYEEDLEVVRHYDKMFVRIVGPLWAGLNIYYLVMFSMFTHYGSRVVNENVSRTWSAEKRATKDEANFSAWLSTKWCLGSANSGAGGSVGGSASGNRAGGVIPAGQMSVSSVSTQLGGGTVGGTATTRLLANRWKARAVATKATKAAVAADVAADAAEAAEADPKDPLLATIAMPGPAAAALVQPSSHALSTAAGTRPHAQPPADVSSGLRFSGIPHAPAPPASRVSVMTLL